MTTHSEARDMQGETVRGWMISTTGIHDQIVRDRVRERGRPSVAKALR